MNKITITIFFLLITHISTISFASEKPAPDKGVRGQVWIEAEGEAYLGEIETQKDVKERAKRDAQNKAVEQAVGAFIKAHTLVSNYQIAEDLIYSSKGKDR